MRYLHKRDLRNITQCGRLNMHKLTRVDPIGVRGSDRCKNRNALNNNISAQNKTMNHNISAFVTLLTILQYIK